MDFNVPKNVDDTTLQYHNVGFLMRLDLWQVFGAQSSLTTLQSISYNYSAFMFHQKPRIDPQMQWSNLQTVHFFR